MTRLLSFRDPHEMLSRDEFAVLIRGWRNIQQADGALDPAMVRATRLGLYRWARRRICRSYRGSWKDAAREVREAEKLVRMCG